MPAAESTTRRERHGWTEHGLTGLVDHALLDDPLAFGRLAEGMRQLMVQTVGARDVQQGRISLHIEAK